MRAAVLGTTSLVLLALSPAVAVAQELSASAGVTLATRYVSNGLELTDGAAIQPWAELGYGGFYLGAWASNLSKDINSGLSTEIDLYFGYRGEAGKFAYDLGYARYFYRSPRENCCGEYKLDLSYALSDQFTLGTNFAYDDEAKVLNRKAYASVAAIENITFDFTYGEINKGGHSYWSAGASYAFNDALAMTLAYHDTDSSKGLAVLSLDYTFGN